MLTTYIKLDSRTRCMACGSRVAAEEERSILLNYI
jgi:hypothetical protein